MKDKKVIVLILSYNGKHLLDDSVSSYLNNNYSNFEVVVIDNGSNDSTEEFVNEKWPNVFVLGTDKNLGYSGGFNFGLDYAFNQQRENYFYITNNYFKADFKVVSTFLAITETDPKIGFITDKIFYMINQKLCKPQVILASF